MQSIQGMLCAAILIAASLLPRASAQSVAIPSGPGLGEPSNHQFQVFSGRLEDPGGAPLSGVLIELHGWNGELIGTTETGSDGAFAFSHVPIGQYTVRGNLGTGGFSEPVTFNSQALPVEVRISSRPAVVRKPVPDDGAGTTRVSLNDLQAPARAKDKLLKGAKALRAEQPDKALQLAGDAIRIDPHWSRAWLLSGLAHQMLGQFDSARQDFQSAASADPTSGAALAALGGAYTRAHQWRQAEFYLQRATAVDAGAWQTWFELSRLQLLQGKYPQAADSARRALSAQPAGPQGCRFFLAEAEAAQGHLPEAARQFQLFLSSNPPPSPAVQEATRKLQLIQQTGQAAAQPAGKP